MRKYRVLIMSLLLVALLAASFLLVGCEKDAPPVFEQGDIATVYIGETSYIIDIVESKATNVEGLLTYLKNTKKIHLVTDDTGYGTYILEIGTLIPASKSEFISIYTSVEKDKSVADWATPIALNGTFVAPSDLGLSGMTFEKDATYLFKLIK